MFQKILILSTSYPNLRDEVWGLSAEDSRNVVMAYSERTDQYKNASEMPVGFVHGMKTPFYPTVLHALAEGWKLMAPPQRRSGDSWNWFLSKED